MEGMNEDGKVNIASKIKLMRRSRGMSQRELAEAIDQSPSSITMYETGRRNPEVSVLEAMADAFNVPLVSFFMDRDITADEIKLIQKIKKRAGLETLIDRCIRMSPEDFDLMMTMADRLTGWHDNEDKSR